MTSSRRAEILNYWRSRSSANPVPETLPKDWRLFNEAIGLPLHPVTRQPTPLLSYQDDIGTCRYKEYIVVKANKIGASEATIREAIYRGTVGDCVGYQMALGAQDYPLAINNLKRLTRIFQQSPLLNPLVDWNHSNQKVLQLIPALNTYYFVLPRNAPAARGWELLKWAWGDEAAHHGLLDDSNYPLAIQTRLANTDGYSRWTSTPLGQRGFLYLKKVAAELPEKDPRHINAKLFLLTYHVAVGHLFTREWVEEMRQKMTPGQFSQEFECKFIAGANAAIEPEVAAGAEGNYDLP